MAHSYAYTCYIKILRLVLPAIAVLGFLSLLIWPWWMERQQNIADLAAKIPATEAHTASDSAAPLQVVKPEYEGIDAKGRTYHITANRVEQSLNPKAPILLFDPIATLTLQPATEATLARTVSLQAVNGRYDAQAQTLDLKDKVILHYMGEFDIETGDLAVDLAQGSAITTTPVQGQGPRGFLSAQSLNIADKGGTIVLKGPSKLVLQPQNAPQPTPSSVPTIPKS